MAELLKVFDMTNANKSLPGEIWAYLRVRKKWWLLPVLLMLLLVGVLIVLGQSSPLSPFIYALF